MTIEEMRTLVNKNYLRIETNIKNRKLMIVTLKKEVDNETYNKIKNSKDEIIKYIQNLEKGKSRINTIIHHLKIIKERYDELPTIDLNNFNNDDPYENLDTRKIEDLNKAIEIAKKNNSKEELHYFIAKKILIEDDKPTPREIEIAKLYDTITNISYDYTKTYDDFGFMDIGAKYREEIILLTDKNLDTIKENFDKEIDLYGTSKDYDFNFSHV